MLYCFEAVFNSNTTDGRFDGLHRFIKTEKCNRRVAQKRRTCLNIQSRLIEQQHEQTCVLPMQKQGQIISCVVAVPLIIVLYKFMMFHLIISDHLDTKVYGK